MTKELKTQKQIPSSLLAWSRLFQPPEESHALKDQHQAIKQVPPVLKHVHKIHIHYLFV